MSEFALALVPCVTHVICAVVPVALYAALHYFGSGNTPTPTAPVTPTSPTPPAPGAPAHPLLAAVWAQVEATLISEVEGFAASLAGRIVTPPAPPRA